MGGKHEIPDHWPAEEQLRGSTQGGLVVPLFPLPNLFLFPGTVMPLHIFEPRYKRMIEDSLDGPGRIAVGAVLQDHHGALDGSPPVFPVAGLGEIARHERLPNGRFLIMLAGLVRVGIREVASEKPYRQVEAVPLREIPATKNEEEVLRGKLRGALVDRSPEFQKLPEDVPLGHLADLLILRMGLPQSRMEDLYARLDIADRAVRTLAEHARRGEDTERTEPGGEAGPS